MRKIAYLIFFYAVVVYAEPQLQLPSGGISAAQLAVVINEEDALSVAVGELYVREHNIAPEHVVRLQFAADASNLDPQVFEKLKKQMDRQLDQSAQGLLLTWLKPYRVACMSITSAFSLGFDRKYCSAKQCDATAPSPYFNSWVKQPYADVHIRPSMMLGASNVMEAKALIDRAKQADQTNPEGTAYLVSTTDQARNVRAKNYGVVQAAFKPWIKVETPNTDSLRNKADVMFYFTGVRRVEALASNTFLPGAVADHLTSYGGMLTDSSHMSALEWLKAGATGSYGTVVEPCAHVQKFPNPGVLMQHYLAGETLLESYWKSVAWPGEGVFVGEPLSRPYKGYFIKKKGQDYFFGIPYLPPGKYRVGASAAIFGPFSPVSTLVSKGQAIVLKVIDKKRPYYRLEFISNAGS